MEYQLSSGYSCVYVCVGGGREAVGGADEQYARRRAGLCLITLTSAPPPQHTPSPPPVRGDLIRILNKLLKRRSKFDAIMIETTGLANPAPVIQTFFVDGAQGGRGAGGGWAPLGGLAIPRPSSRPSSWMVRRLGGLGVLRGLGNFGCMGGLEGLGV